MSLVQYSLQKFVVFIQHYLHVRPCVSVDPFFKAPSPYKCAKQNESGRCGRCGRSI